MMTVSVEYFVPREITVAIPPKYADVWLAALKDEDERTPEEWDMVEDFSVDNMISEITGDEVYELNIISYTK